jgi:hypothetical protein
MKWNSAIPAKPTEENHPMSRQPRPTLEPEVLPGDVPNHALTLADEAAVRTDDAEMAFEAARALGQIESAQFSALCAEKVAVETFIKLKKNKAYRAIWLTDADGNRRRCADLEEFCERFMGHSYGKLKELASTYHLLGADLFEQAEKLGFKRNDYRALKALPADDQEVIKQAMSPEVDRDQILDLMQELSVRHASEKAELTAKAKEATETADARSEVIAKKESRINALEEDLHKSRRRLESQTPDEVGEQLRQETAGVGWSIVGRLNVDLAKAFAALDAHARAADCSHDEFMSGVLFDIQRAIHAIREDYAVKERPDGDARPDWTRPDYNPQLDADTEAARQNFIKEHGYDPMPQFPSPHPAGNA